MARDIGRILLAKTDLIINNWIERIRQDSEELESSRSLPYESVRDSIPSILKAIATLLSQILTDQPKKLENEALEHGEIRAEQGYDLTEVVREYSLLRQGIFEVLKTDLLLESAENLIELIEIIDSTIDQVISLSLDSYLQSRLGELEQIRGQLILTNQELERLVASQRKNFSHLAHDLKTPLNCIMGFSNLLLRQQQKNHQEPNSSLSLQFTEKVIQNSRILLQLINDTLEISRYEEGKIPLNLSLIDIRSLLRTVIESLELSASQKSLDVSFNCAQAPEQVLSDPLKLRQIVTNLISNAIRYTPAGTITITCQAEANSQWSVSVEDTGIGIPLEAQTQIFQPYFRLNTDDSDFPNSTGLGLAIVDKLVKLLQGKVSLVSRPTQGSTFSVTFPLVTTSPD